MLKLPDFNKLLISSSLTQHCRVSGLSCHHYQAPVAGELLPWLSPARGYPSPFLLTQGVPCSDWLPRFCITAGHRGAGQEGEQPRRQGRVTASSCTHLHSTRGTLKASLPRLLGHSSTRGIFPLQKGTLTCSGPSTRPAGTPVGVWAQCVTLQKDATDEFNRKKQKPTKPPPGTRTARWSTMQMQHEENTGKNLARFSFQTLDRQADPLTDATKSSCLSKGNLAHGEAQRSLTKAVVRKKP